jgi:hypothetical protein
MAQQLLRRELPVCRMQSPVDAGYAALRQPLLGLADMRDKTNLLPAPMVLHAFSGRQI